MRVRVPLFTRQEGGYLTKTKSNGQGFSWTGILAKAIDLPKGKLTVGDYLIGRILTVEGTFTDRQGKERPKEGVHTVFDGVNAELRSVFGLETSECIDAANQLSGQTSGAFRCVHVGKGYKLFASRPQDKESKPRNGRVSQVLKSMGLG